MNIRTGLPLSRKQTTADKAQHTYTVLTLKAMDNDGVINTDFTEPCFTAEPLKSEYFTKAGDVLIRLSAPYTATVITEGKENLLVSQHFSIIRNKEMGVNPHFLRWWLTQNRKRFYQSASGATHMGTISSGYIAELIFEPPPFEIQVKIGSLLELATRERELLARLSESREKLINATLNKIVNNGGKNL